MQNLEDIKAFEKMRGKAITKPDGQLYEVKIPQDSEMLLWDKPLSEHPEGVRAALESSGLIVDGKYGDGMGATPMFPGGMTFSGEAIYKRLTERFFAEKSEVTSAARKQSEREASEYLASIGIKGIKYLDSSSRDAGEGSFNYVVFDDADVEIVQLHYSSNGDVEGFHDPKTGKSYLNADVLAPDTIGPVLVHEMWHSANRAGALDAINARAAALIKSGKGNPFFDRVSRMLRDAGETSDEEHAAYLVRAWEQDTINTPAPVKRWIQNLVAAIRAWMFNKGIVLKSEQLTEADIAAVARMRAKEQVAVRDGDGAVQFSKAKFEDVGGSYRTRFAEFVKGYRDSQPVDSFDYERSVKQIASEIENDWHNGNPDEYSRRFGPDEIHQMLRDENPAFYDEDNDLTEEGDKRYVEIESELSDQLAREYLGAPEKTAVDLTNPRDAAKVLHSYLESVGKEPSAIGGSGKSRSQYFTLDGKKIRISDHALPVEYSEADFDLVLADAGDDVRSDGRIESLPITEDEAQKRIADFAEILLSGNNGNLDPTSPDIRYSQAAPDALNSRLAYQGYEKADVPRVQSARNLAGILKKLDEGKITQENFEFQVRVLALRMSDVAETKAANRMVVERERGADIVREKLIAARRRGEIDPDTTEFALWALNQNPALAEGLGISVRERPEGSRGAAGDYNPASSVMRVFKGAANPETAVHEILHHAERMMSAEVQAGIRKEWSNAYSKALAKAEPKQREALEKILEAMAGSQLAQKAVADAFQDGTLDADTHYQLVNPSEFWAVNATSIMRGRYEAASWVGKARQWLVEMLEKVKGMLGMRSDASVLRGLQSVLDGNGERLSKKMLTDLASFNQITNLDGAEIRYSRAADFTRPDRSLADVKDKLIYEAQDRFVDLKRMQEAIEQEFGPVDDQFDARTSETLYKGRVSKRINDFHAIEVKPLLQKMARNKVSQRELSDYLLARGAPERNEQIAKINPDMPDGGAGTNSKGELMTTEAANNYLANIDPVRRMLLDKLAGMVDQITAGTRAMMVSEGLEDPKTIQAWERTYQYYVPMMKEEAEQGILAHHIQGKGFSNKGGFSRRAMGSEKEVTNMLAHVVMQRDAVITRAEKNRVGLSLYGLALTANNSDFWTVIRPNMSKKRIMESLASMGIDPSAYENMDMAPTMRVVSKKTGLVEHRPNPLYKNMPNALIVKVQGEDRVILFNEKNERAMRLVRSLKNDDRLLQIDLAGSIIGKTTRFMASMSTQYNPAFAMVNMARDMTSGMLNLSTTELAGKQLQVLANVPNAIQGIARALSGRGQTEWSQLFDQFQLDGGQTGFREIFANAFEKTKDIEREMKRLEQAGKLTPGAMTHATLDLIDNFNSTIENAVRLSAYKVALDNGMSRPQAAKLARELTVDFNRQGRTGRELSPMYAFMNAAIQGNARTLLTLTSKAGRKIVVGGLALGAMQALMLMLAGFDDDEIPDYTKTNYLIIPTGGKGYALIPMALGFHVLPNTGRVITELLMTGGKNAGKKTYKAFGELVGAFNPLGGGDVLTADGALRTIMPTVLDPLVDLGFNKNFAGNSISKETFPGDARPGFKNVKETTARNASGQIYTGIAKIINRATLGNDYKRGLASPTPEQIRYLSSSIGGGLYREIEKTYDTAMALAYGKEVKPSQIPYGGRWHGEVDDYQVERSRYFENKRKVDETRSQLKLAEKAGDRNAYQAVVDGNKVQASSIKMLASINRSISDLNRMVNENVDDQETLKRIDSERERLMREFNLRIKMMEKQLEDQQQKEKQ